MTPQAMKHNANSREHAQKGKPTCACKRSSVNTINSEK
jgi:hypothetical protein